eukprot:2520460-Amphidinium_carterae.1
MEGFDNPGLDVGWETKPTHPVHGLLKSADSLPLHSVPPARPLGINPQITSGDFHWGQKFVFSVRAIAYDHSFLRVHLHVGLL